MEASVCVSQRGGQMGRASPWLMGQQAAKDDQPCCTITHWHTHTQTVRERSTMKLCLANEHTHTHRHTHTRNARGDTDPTAANTSLGVNIIIWLVSSSPGVAG